MFRPALLALSLPLLFSSQPVEVLPGRLAGLGLGVAQEIEGFQS